MIAIDDLGTFEYVKSGEMGRCVGLSPGSDKQCGTHTSFKLDGEFICIHHVGPKVRERIIVALAELQERVEEIEKAIKEVA